MAQRGVSRRRRRPREGRTHEIFISDRHIDTEASSGHLGADLRGYFDEHSVFKNTRPNSIAWGADWVKSLTHALEHCEALLTPMGPQWESCERTSG